MELPSVGVIHIDGNGVGAIMRNLGGAYHEVADELASLGPADENPCDCGKDPFQWFVMEVNYRLDGVGAKEGEATPAKPEMSVKEMERAMWEAVERLDFERAAALRDLIAEARGVSLERKPSPRGFRSRPRRARERTRK